MNTFEHVWRGIGPGPCTCDLELWPCTWEAGRGPRVGGAGAATLYRGGGWAGTLYRNPPSPMDKQTGMTENLTFTTPLAGSNDVQLSSVRSLVS